MRGRLGHWAAKKGAILPSPVGGPNTHTCWFGIVDRLRPIALFRTSARRAYSTKDKFAVNVVRKR